MFVSPPVWVGPVVHCASVTVTPVRVTFPVFVKVRVKAAVLPLATACVAGDLINTMEGADARVTVSVSVAESTRLPTKVPCALAILVTEPLVISVFVMVYVAVQVMLAPGTRVAVAGQASSVDLSSVTVNGPLRVN